MPRRFGLIDKNNGAQVPLDSIKVQVNVAGFTAHVTATLNYSNKEENPIEAIYIFPLDEQAAVCGFQATIDGRTIVAEVREKQEARDAYDDAISSGHSAYLLEESDESSDIFQISVGNLPPKQSAAVELKFVTELAVEKEGRVVFVLPTVLNPRYSPGDNPASISATVPAIAEVHSLYTFDFEMHVKSASAITEITSPSNSLSVEIDDTGDKTTAYVKLAEPHKADKDLEVQILSAEPFKPHALVEGGVAPPDGKPGNEDFLSKPVVMLNFFPEFPNSSSEVGEFIFVIDRSGSMSGGGIKNARDTLLLFLKSLPDGCYFNVVGFGSSYESLFKKSEKYDDKTVEEACNHAKKLQANLGGTEILEPLKWVFKQPLIKGAPRQVFLLTDGEVGNTQQVIDLVRQNANTARCFSFGIGFGASTALIKGVARAGRGTAEFVKSEDRLQAKVIKTLQHALQPVLNEVRTTWSIDGSCSIKKIPSNPPPIFSGDRLVLFGQLEGIPEEGNTQMKCCVTVEGLLECDDKSKAIKHSVSCHIERNFDQSVSFSPELTIHRLAAKSLIQEKQDQLDKEREDIIRVSKSANVVSKLTSFVAVDKESHEAIHSAMHSHTLTTAVMDMSYHSVGFAMGVPNSLCRRALCVNDYDPTIEDCYGDDDLWEESSTETTDMAQRPARQGIKSKTASFKGNSVDVRNESKTNDKGKGGIKRFFKRLSFTKKKGKSKRESSVKTASSKEERNDETPQDKVLKEKMSSQRLQQNQKEETTSASVTMNKESLIEIISLQKASGAWELTEQLAKLCGSTKSDLQHTCPYTLAAAKDDGKVWATALALVLLAGNFGEKKEEWDMVAKKGKKWLKCNIVDRAEYLNTIAAAANALNFSQPQPFQLD